MKTNTVKNAYIILENGVVFEGEAFGAIGEATGEVVFSTSMAGYLESVTDKSNYGQIVIQTFPLIGNYGIIPSDFESDSAWVSAYIVKHPCAEPSNFRSEGHLDEFLRDKGVVGLCGVDTRALAKLIRENGAMNAKITQEKPENVNLAEIKAHSRENAVAGVSVKKAALYSASQPKYIVALLDLGFRESVKNELIERGCDTWVLPHNSSIGDILAVKPDGILLSNGPGNPADNADVIENLREIIKTGIPMFGICLGHQLLALANGFCTKKLKHGHRGDNQPVRDLKTGRIYITSQNHGYAVDSESVCGDIAQRWFENVNDNSLEGIAYKNAPAFSAQFYPKLDTSFLFDKFIDNMEARKNAKG